VGTVIDLASRRLPQGKDRETAYAQLPRVLAQLLAAGATEFTRVALDAWGNRSVEPDELLELCSTYAAVAGLETI
jgi:hypothetical protein